jgi:hypothetical protein
LNLFHPGGTHASMKSTMALGLGCIAGLVLGWVGGFRSVDSAASEDLARQAAAYEASTRRLNVELQRTHEALRAAEAAAKPTPEVTQRAIVPTAAIASPISDVSAPTTSPSNTAILNFLGEAVPAPADLDPKYSAAELSISFRGACDALGVNVDKLAVDTSEFPFVVHGLVEHQPGNDFFRRVETQLREIPGYKYAGSTTGHTKDGATFFAMSITPPSAYPRDQASAIQRRLMLRIQMIGAAWNEPLP